MLDFDLTINVPTIIAGLTAIYTMGRGVGKVSAKLDHLEKISREVEGLKTDVRMIGEDLSKAQRDIIILKTSTT